MAFQFFAWFRNAPPYQKAILLAILIGFATMITFVLLEYQEDRFTSLYIYPDSYTHSQGRGNTSFLYGIRSYERDRTAYTLQFFVNDRLVGQKDFDLDPGKVIEERSAIDISNDSLPTKIQLVLSSGAGSYEVHYWILGTAPVAAFSAKPTQGKEPLTVTFYDNSTNSPSSWAWNFGDGTTSTLRNPVHTFTNGSYSVSLVASNSGGEGSERKTNFITVLPNVTISAVSQVSQVQRVLLRETLTVRDRQSILDIIALDYYRGPYANDLVAYSREVFSLENISNAEPEPGYEYLLVKVLVKDRQGTTPIFVAQASFRTCVKGTNRCSDAERAFITLPTFEDKVISLDDSSSGWMVFIVPVSEVIDLAYYDSSGLPAGYIQIR
ncbi:MAG TPA: PKD domain-containing protein [Methanomicrobiales archaeon]|nr:PKD domain-containing protein [Methanomicrobiales archaeon]